MSLLAYSFSSGIMLLALAAVYMLMMRNTTHFGFNRACLVTIMVISQIAPFINLPISQTNGEASTEIGYATISAVANVPSETRSHEILRIIGMIYLAGVGLIALRTVANLCFIIYLGYNSRRTVIDKHKVRVHDHDNIPPMSWGGDIYISETTLRESDAVLAMILAHEEAHRKQYHWADLLLSNIALAINWYNPAAWMIQHELIAVHEYDADRVASMQSVDKTEYQLLLIKKTAGTRFQAFADSLNHSSLKKRITMMMKKQSKMSTRLRSLALVPAMALAFAGSNNSCVKAAQQEVSAADPLEQAVEADTNETTKNKPNELEETVVVGYGSDKKTEEATEIATMAEYPGGITAIYQKLAETLNYVGDINENGTVVVSFTIDAEGKVVNPHIVKGLSEAKNNEVLRVVKLLDNWEPAISKDGKKVACEFTLPVKFKSVGKSTTKQ